MKIGKVVMSSPVGVVVDYMQESAPILELLTRKLPPKLYSALIKEAPTALYKALTEIAYNITEENIQLTSQQKVFSKKQSQFLKRLAKATASIRSKKSLLSKPKNRKAIAWMCQLTRGIWPSSK